MSLVQSKTAKLYTAACTLTLAIVFSGCGGMVEYSDGLPASKFGSVIHFPPQSPGSLTTPPPVTQTPPMVEPGSVASERRPVYEFEVKGFGYSNQYGVASKSAKIITVRTHHTLKISFKAGVNSLPINVNGYGFTPQYSKLGVYIAVGELKQPTPLLGNGLRSGTAQRSPAMDFSSGIPNPCPSSDTACRVDASIWVGQANYNLYCDYWGIGCPHNKVYDTHPWNGVVYVETEDTQTL